MCRFSNFWPTLHVTFHKWCHIMLQNQIWELNTRIVSYKLLRIKLLASTLSASFSLKEVLVWVLAVESDIIKPFDRLYGMLCASHDPSCNSCCHFWTIWSLIMPSCNTLQSCRWITLPVLLCTVKYRIVQCTMRSSTPFTSSSINPRLPLTSLIPHAQNVYSVSTNPIQNSHIDCALLHYVKKIYILYPPLSVVPWRGGEA